MRRPVGHSPVMGRASALAGAGLAFVLPASVSALTFVTVPSGGVLTLPAICAGLLCLIGIGARLRAPVGPWATGMASGAFVSLLWWVAAAIPVSPAAPAVGPEAQVWHLSTGSTIDYTKIDPTGSGGVKSPVVVLHGGPGVADTASLVRFAASLHLRDRGAYVYDEVGAGGSSRLTPSSYGVERDVADLEAVREAIGAARMVLVGHSYGGYLAASYAARYPNRVERLVLASPGPLSSGDHSSDRLQERLSLRQRMNVFGYALRPRQVTTYVLSRWDPTRARRVVPDLQADAMSDELVHRAAPALFCNRSSSTAKAATGAYRMQVDPLPPSPQREANLRGALPDVSAPTLILKGSCDYLSWESALDYRRLLADSRICLVEGAGHNLFEERAGYVSELVRRFIVTGQTCHHGSAGDPAPTYQGGRR